MKLEKMAEKDAHDWARAEMFFGEGAGVRRRHLQAQISEKMNTLPEYEIAFSHFYNRQNMAEHAIAAAKERRNLDRLATAGKNVRALKSGNLHNLSSGVFLVVGVAYLAHATGADKKIQAEAKKLYAKAKTEVRFRKARMQGRNVEKIFG